MTFLAPERLWLLAVPAILVVWYLVALRGAKRHAVRFSNVELLDRVAPDRPGWRRHLPAAAFVLALGVVVAAFARPVGELRVPREQATVILSIDVSLSMDADDVPPTRLDAAKSAAKEFVRLAPGELRIGLVPFAGVALPAVPPTTDRLVVERGIDNLVLGEGTAVGEAIFAGLALIDAERRDDGGEVPAAIVVLSDGTTTMGRAPEEAVAAAVDAGVEVSTISFGTPEGRITYEGEVIPVPPDEASLRSIAEATGGRFSTAATADELQRILDDIGSEVAFETETRELWEYALAVGLVLLLLGGGMSIVWMSKLP